MPSFVKLIVDIRDSEGLSWQKIANKLNSLGIRTRFGKSWKSATVFRIYRDNKSENQKIKKVA